MGRRTAEVRAFQAEEEIKRCSDISQLKVNLHETNNCAQSETGTNGGAGVCGWVEKRLYDV